MAKEFEKTSETEFKAIEEKVVEESFTVKKLKADLERYTNDLVYYQRLIDETNALLAKATELGVVEEVVVVPDPIVVDPVDPIIPPP